MKILMLSQMVPYLPCRDGFRLCPANLLRHLSRRHEIHLAAPEAGESAAELAWCDSYCASTEWVKDGPDFANNSARALAMVERLQPDVCHIEGPMLAPLCAALSPRIPVVISIHDSVALRYRDFARSLPSWRARAKSAIRAVMAQRDERRWYRSGNRLVVFSQEDREALRGALAAERIAVIPNGIDTEHWAFQRTPVKGRIVFTGNMNWPPNVEAAAHFTRNIFPAIRRKQPAAEFWIVGAEPAPRVRELGATPGVYVTGSVPDMREHLRQASVYVSPVLFGAGVKNKILEAMAVGAPIVATPRSLTGSSAENGRHLLMAEQPEDFANAVVRLLEDPDFAERLAVAARERVERECSWEQVSQRFEELYDQVCGEPQYEQRRKDVIQA